MRARTYPPLSNEVRRALIRYRITDLLHGVDASETFLSLWLVAQGLLYAAPKDSTGAAPAFRYVHELGGDWLLVLLFLPLGLVKVGCMLRPLVASIPVHKSALLLLIGECIFLSIVTWRALPWSSVPITFILLAILAVLTFLHLDRE